MNTQEAAIMNKTQSGIYRRTNPFKKTNDIISLKFCKGQLDELNSREKEIVKGLLKVIFGKSHLVGLHILKKALPIRDSLKDEFRHTGFCKTASMVIIQTAKDIYNEEQYRINSNFLEKKLFAIDQDIINRARSALKMVFNIRDTKEGVNDISGISILNLLPPGIKNQDFGFHISLVAQDWQKARNEGKSDSEIINKGESEDIDFNF